MDMVIIAVALVDSVAVVILDVVVLDSVAFTVDVLVEVVDVALMYVELVESELRPLLVETDIFDEAEEVNVCSGPTRDDCVVLVPVPFALDGPQEELDVPVAVGKAYGYPPVGLHGKSPYPVQGVSLGGNPVGTDSVSTSTVPEAEFVA